MDEWQAAHANLKPESYRPPRWFVRVLNERLPDAVAEYREHRWTGSKRHKKLPSEEVPEFIFNSNYARLLDHFGTGLDGNFICEPYGGFPDLEGNVSDVADLLGLRYTINREAYHAEGCVRITFYKP